MIIIFYHICGIGNWRNIVIEQLELLEKIPYDQIRIGFLGDKKLIEPFLTDKIILVANEGEWEYPTLNKLIEYCNINDDHYICYIHSKGVMSGANNWRQLMNYWIIERWEDNIRYLKEGYDTCGILKLKNHYRGNFWWCNSKFIRGRKPITNYNDRLWAEFWLLSKKGKFKSLYQNRKYTSDYLYTVF